MKFIIKLFVYMLPLAALYYTAHAFADTSIAETLVFVVAGTVQTILVVALISTEITWTQK